MTIKLQNTHKYIAPQTLAISINLCYKYLREDQPVFVNSTQYSI